MPVATNFGDALTQGNATFQQNLFVQGSTAVFSGNITASTSTVRLANSTTSYASLYSVAASATTLNVAGGATITSAGVFANLVSTVNVLATNFNSTGTFTGNLVNTSTLVCSSNMGIGTSPVARGANLLISGNLWAPNIFSTNIFSTNLNAVTANIFTVLGTANAVTTLVGNLYVSNGVTSVTVLAAGRINASAINVTTIFTGETFSPANYSAANLVITGNITYSEDLMNRGPWLLPSVANASAIQAWISTTCNAASIPTRAHWASGPLVFSNAAIGPVGSSDYGGSVLLPDGRVLFVPHNAATVGFYNPASGLFSTVAPAGLTNASNKFRGGVLVPNGNVVFVPWNNSNIGLFNPMTSIYSNVAVGAQGGTFRFQGGVLSPTGNVVLVPRDSANIGVFNPTTLSLTNVGPISGSTSLFGSGVLLPNGNVVMTPMNTNANIGMYNTYSLTISGFSNVGPIATNGYSWECSALAPNGNVIFFPSTSANIVVYNPSVVSSPIGPGGFSNIPFIGPAEVGGKNFFQGGVVLPTGNVICCPTDASNIGVIDPKALTYSNSVPVSAATAKFFGATLVPNGQVILCPYNSANVGVINTITPAPVEFCLAPYFNKF